MSVGPTAEEQKKIEDELVAAVEQSLTRPESGISDFVRENVRRYLKEQTAKVLAPYRKMNDPVEARKRLKEDLEEMFKDLLDNNVVTQVDINDDPNEPNVLDMRFTVNKIIQTINLQFKI